MLDDTARLPVTDAPADMLGRLNPGDDDPKKRSAEAESDPMGAFYSALDKAFEEAFSNKYVTGDPEVIRLVQAAARECLKEELQGNALLRLSPEKLMSMQKDIESVAHSIVREVVATEAKTGSLNAAKNRNRLPTNLRNHIVKEIDNFKFKHLGFAAEVDAQRLKELGAQQGKPTQ